MNKTEAFLEGAEQAREDLRKALSDYDRKSTDYERDWKFLRAFVQGFLDSTTVGRPS